MKILVFGADGGTGSEVVRQALDQGHKVTAFVLDPSTYTKKHKNLEVVGGNALDHEAVAKALPGHDAVVSVIGVPPTKKSKIRTETAKVIVSEMEKSKVKRFITQSTIGIGESRQMLNWLYKYLLVPLLLKGAFEDHAGQEEAVKNSDIDWTILRAGALNNNPRTGKYRVDIPLSDRSKSLKLARADAADFILKELDQNNYVRKTVAVAY